MQRKSNKSKPNKREHNLNPGAMNLWTSPPQEITQGFTVSDPRLNVSEDIQRVSKIIPEGEIVV